MFIHIKLQPTREIDGYYSEQERELLSISQMLVCLQLLNSLDSPLQSTLAANSDVTPHI